jgi:ribonuclease BN (tRNA processing enzyme)
MRITFLGTGTPLPDPKRSASTLLVEIDNEKLLIDAGRGVTTQLTNVGIHPKDIDAVFITHHHFDHIGNLGDLLLTVWHSGRRTPLPIYGPQGTMNIITALIEQVYARDIAFTRFTEPELLPPMDMLRPMEVTPGLVCDTGRWRVFTEYVNHGNSLGLSQEDWPCVGYRIEAEGKITAISGDTVDCSGLDRLAHDADILIQCCYLAEAEINNPLFELLASHVIASSGQVGKIAARNRVKRLALTHFRPKSKEMMDAVVADVRQDYSGSLVMSEDLMEITV